MEHTPTGTGHADFLLSAGGTLLSIGLIDYNHIAAAIAATGTAVLTTIRIYQAVKEIRKK